MQILQCWPPHDAKVTHAILDIKICNVERSSSVQWISTYFERQRSNKPSLDGDG